MLGGHTMLNTHHGVVSVKPEPGRALVFHHKVRHAGQEVTKGEKVIVRSEVVYGLK